MTAKPRDLEEAPTFGGHGGPEGPGPWSLQPVGALGMKKIGDPRNSTASLGALYCLSTTPGRTAAADKVKSGNEITTAVVPVQLYDEPPSLSTTVQILPFVVQYFWSLLSTRVAGQWPGS